ncbi:transcription factor [Thecamonas trahens ATCC 50062]|uniref:Transcription factor n=1 Tax=Thecamonas trahens ATCC 50062 TaxID=461836 RepID=A0A0L0D8C6_THETB|nr:transcription factor [Thecamonas trahens ATCC 50062]KNC48495.1 transcription factor [Thecamonas trahens ATCC 50062]|eukprot:XP_013758605.1 transcription factor [Thecamonas trahens ATCC 50062]
MDYEAKRLENIRRNQEMLKSLELDASMTALMANAMRPVAASLAEEHGVAAEVAAAPVVVGKKRRRAPAPDAKARQKKAREAAAPVRQSRRIRSQVEAGRGVTSYAEEALEGEARPVAKRSKALDTVSASGKSEEFDDVEFVTMEEYFTARGIEPKVRVVGKYEGWVNPDIAAEHGIPDSASDAWRQGGGGQFSFANPMGIGSKNKVKGAKPRGWSSAKFWSSKLLCKNPNAYFYRHVAPGCERALGEWTRAEHELFIKVAAEHGAGNKWGLFASYIPNRVGYQCSAYYRHVMLKEGIIWDPNWLMAPNGVPHYFGPRVRRRS